MLYCLYIYPYFQFNNLLNKFNTHNCQFNVCICICLLLTFIRISYYELLLKCSRTPMRRNFQSFFLSISPDQIYDHICFLYWSQLQNTDSYEPDTLYRHLFIVLGRVNVYLRSHLIHNQNYSQYSLKEMHSLISDRTYMRTGFPQFAKK